MGNFHFGPLVGSMGDGIAWVRLGERGPGISVKHTRKRRLVFSERNGRGVQVGPFRIKLVQAYETGPAVPVAYCDGIAISPAAFELSIRYAVTCSEAQRLIDCFGTLEAEHRLIVAQALAVDPFSDQAGPNETLVARGDISARVWLNVDHEAQLPDGSRVALPAGTKLVEKVSERQ